MKQKKSVVIYKNNLVKISINKEWCKACGICIEFCPKDVLAPDDQGKPYPKNIDDCIKCDLCELRCPDLSIRIEGIKDKNE